MWSVVWLFQTEEHARIWQFEDQHSVHWGLCFSQFFHLLGIYFAQLTAKRPLQSLFAITWLAVLLLLFHSGFVNVVSCENVCSLINEAQGLNLSFLSVGNSITTHCGLDSKWGDINTDRGQHQQLRRWHHEFPARPAGWCSGQVSRFVTAKLKKGEVDKQNWKFSWEKSVKCLGVQVFGMSLLGRAFLQAMRPLCVIMLSLSWTDPHNLIASALTNALVYFCGCLISEKLVFPVADLLCLSCTIYWRTITSKTRNRRTY